MNCKEENKIRVLHSVLPAALSFPGLGVNYSKFIRNYREQIFPRGKKNIEKVELESGCLLYVDTGDRLGCDIYFGYFNELLELRVFTELVAKDSVIVDIGANIGIYTVVAGAKLREKGRLLAFEPGEGAYKLLKKNIQVNNLDEVVDPFNICIGNYNGETNFFNASESSLSGISSTGRTDGKNSSSKIKTLDSFNLKVDLLKIDVEGFEYAVFEGGMSTIERSDNIAIMFENSSKNLSEQRRELFVNALGKLYGIGLRAWFLDSMTLKFTPLESPEGAIDKDNQNLFFVFRNSKREKQFKNISINRGLSLLRISESGNLNLSDEKIEKEILQSIVTHRDLDLVIMKKEARKFYQEIAKRDKEIGIMSENLKKYRAKTRELSDRAEKYKEMVKRQTNDVFELQDYIHKSISGDSIGKYEAAIQRLAEKVKDVKNQKQRYLEAIVERDKKIIELKEKNQTLLNQNLSDEQINCRKHKLFKENTRSLILRYINRLAGSKISRLLIKRKKGKKPLTGRLPKWDLLIAEEEELWKESIGKSSGKEILISTCVGGQAAVTILESLLGVALTLRGAKVRMLLCDMKMPACLNVHFRKIGGYSKVNQYELKDTVCQGCFAKGDALYRKTGLELLYYSQFIDDSEVDKIRELADSLSVDEIKIYKKGGLTLGEHAYAGALRFLSMGQLPDEEDAVTILKRYFESALITETVIRRVTERDSYSSSVFNHGIYVPHGVIGEVCRQKGIRVANWQVAYRQKCFIFSQYETYHHALLKEPVENWDNLELTPEREKKIMEYLDSRRYGTKDWIWFHHQPKHELKDIEKELKVDFNKPVISLLTNVFWDAQLHYKANAFKDMLDWLLKTVDYFIKREDLQLLIRIHPAEVRGAIPSRQPLTEEIKKFYPKLPHNIKIIPPESQLSTYTLSENSDAVLIYGTKTGVELTSIGVPVIVGGEAWIRNKGLTRDASSPEEYYSILDELPFKRKMDEKVVKRARKYAFHFFFRRFIELSFMKPCDKGVPYEIDINSIKELERGRDKGLDVLCEGIINGTDFIYPVGENI